MKDRPPFHTLADDFDRLRDALEELMHAVFGPPVRALARLIEWCAR